MVLKTNKVEIITGSMFWIIAVLSWVIAIFLNEDLLLDFVLAVIFAISFILGFFSILKGFD